MARTKKMVEGEPKPEEPVLDPETGLPVEEGKEGDVEEVGQ